MLNPTERAMIEDILRVTTARLAAPSGAHLVLAGKTSPAHLTLEDYEKCGGQFFSTEMAPLGGFAWLRAAAVLSARDVDLDNDGLDCDPRWARLLASRSADSRERARIAARIADKTPGRRHIIKDIRRVFAAAGLKPPLRPAFEQYRELGGLHLSHHINARGGWKALCAAVGFTTGRESEPDAQTLRSLVIEDVARVAAALAAADLVSSNGLSKYAYLCADGRRYAEATINAVQGPGGWADLCRAAGVKPAGLRCKLRAWQKTPSASADMTRAQLDAALDLAAAVVVRPPTTVNWLKARRAPGWKWRPPRAKAQATDRAALDRDEVLADLRLAARSAGVPVARLQFETYLACGGRYTAQDLLDLGGFTTARQAAAAAAADDADQFDC